MNVIPLKLLDEEKRLLWRLRTTGEMSRTQLADSLQVSATAVTKLSKGLVSLGLVEEVARAEAQGRGRPTVPLRISPAGGFAVGVTIHPGLLEIAIINYAGGVISLTAEEIEPCDPLFLARQIDRRIQELAVEHRLLGTRLLGVGIAVPGPALSRDGNRWHIVHSLPGWRNVPLREIFDETMGMPVWIENDATAAVLAEYYLGGLIQRCSTAAVILLGHGIGAGIVSDGRLLRGEVGSAGEIGMLYPGIPRPSTFDLLDTLHAAGCDISSMADFEHKVQDHEATVDQWLDRAAQQLELAINSAIAWLDPGALRLSGSLPKAVLQRLADRLNQGAIAWGGHRAECEVGAFEIEVSDLGRASSALGAALLPIHASTARS